MLKKTLIFGISLTQVLIRNVSKSKVGDGDRAPKVTNLREQSGLDNVAKS